MRGFRSKLIYTLIVFFVGFATAIYTLAPAPEDSEAYADAESKWSISDIKTEAFAQACNVSIHKCVNFFKDMSAQAGDFIKEKLKEEDES